MINEFYFENPTPQEEALHRESMQNLLEGARLSKLKTTLCAPVNFREHQRINYILWIFDPLEVNHLASIDEYICYVPRIQQLIRQHADSSVLAEFLYQMQSAFRQVYSVEECREVADEILYG